MRLLVESGKIRPEQVSRLVTEARELLAMIVSSINTARPNNSQSAIRNPKFK